MGGDQEVVLVWAKMKSYCPWPGFIAEPTPDVLRKRPKNHKYTKCVFFFGTRNFAWVDEKDIHPYIENRLRFTRAVRGVLGKKAVTEVEQYLEDPILYKSNCDINGPQVDQNQLESTFDKLRQSVSNGDSADDTIIDEDGALSVRSAPNSGRKTAARKRNSAALKANSSFNIKFPASVKRTAKQLREDDKSSKSAPAAKRCRNDTPSPKTGRASVAARFSSRGAGAVDRLLDRPEFEARADIILQNSIDMDDISVAMRSKNINPSSLNFGFLGLGIMGSGIVKNLVHSGHKVVVWNRTVEKCEPFVKHGARVAPTPCDVMDIVDITFSCVSDPAVAKEIVFGNCGILSSESIAEGKGYVEMTGMDDTTSNDIAEAINGRGGRYLEAMIQGSKREAEDGTLVILAAGEKSLFDECQTCFEAMGKNSFYMGDVGFATKMYMILQSITGAMVAGLAEGMALGDRVGLDLKDILEVLELTNIASPALLAKGRAIVTSDFSPCHPLQHLQKDMKLALCMAELAQQPVHIISTVNEMLKHSRRSGYSEHDSCAVYIKTRL